MKKIDFLAAFIIGEACALIFILILGPLEVPDFLIKLARFFPIVLPVLSISGTFAVSIFEKRIPTLYQAGRSFLVGILNTFIDLGILTFLMQNFGIFAGWPYVIFKAASFSVATVNSYLWNKFWAFEKKDVPIALKETSKFYLITLGGVLINISVSSLIVNLIGPRFGLLPEIWAYVGAMAAVFCGFAWNFSGYKLIVFKK